MNKSEILEKLKAVVTNILGEEGIAIDENTSLKQLEGWDSLMHITLLNALEKEFSVKFSFEEFLAFDLVAPIIDCIESKL